MVFTNNIINSPPTMRFTREKHFFVVFLVVYCDVFIDMFPDIGIYITINLICDDLISPYNSKKHIVLKKRW